MKVRETVPMAECEVSDLRIMLDRTGDCTLIDVREFAEFAGARIPGSKLVPLGDIEHRTGEIDRSGPVYVVCRTGRRSAEAQRRLLALGFKDVRNVRGGIESWRKAGFPLDRDARAPWSLERQVRLVAGTLVLVSVLLSILVSPPFIWLAGFVGAGLAFAAVTDTCAMGMLLMRLPWNRR